MKGQLCFYCAETNTVEESETRITYEQFVNEEHGHNSFWVGPTIDGVIQISADRNEMILLREDDQTVKQGVMLFALLLNMREEARE